MARQARWASVAVARPLPAPLTYAVPALLADRLEVGHVVLVPLGRGRETGYVVDLPEAPGLDPAKVKPLARLLDPTPAFDARQLSFFRWIADYYLSPLGQVIQTALPKVLRAKSLRVVEPTAEGVDALTDGLADEANAQVLREVVSRPGLTARGLARRLVDEVPKAEVDRALARLVRRGWVQWDEREVRESRPVVQRAALVGSVDAALARTSRAGTRMKAVLRALDRAGGAVDVPVLVAEQGAGCRSALKRLAEVGAVEITEREARDALEEVPAQGSATPPVLNADQAEALRALTAEDAAGAWLLHGVTGSGKTEVFLGAAAHVLAQGRQVCVLVPEIGLTPQLVGRFKARFGDDVAVLHSGLTGRDRLAHWRRIRAGEAPVTVGARSALFAPFQDLALLVVDEEHDDSYKQDDGVRYHARDLAVVLGVRWRCPVVLASATPSLETWANARRGRYRLLRLPERATPRPVPRVELVDMTALPRPDGGGPRPILHPDTVAALRDTFREGGQAIVLYNRRGFATMVQCTSCGATWECPNCGISMTLHKGSRTLACHYCGLKRPLHDHCPSCGQATLEELGKGTERVEEVLAATFPEVPIGRMDADTTAVRGAHHRILEDFREGRTRMLVGTQIVAKGHDFPGVHTAVVVSADQGFRMPDFRAAERTHALLVQVAGRAGRGDVAGRVLVQTWKPDHPALHQLDDVAAFLDAEARLRRVMRYPPFRRLVLVRLDGVKRPDVGGAAVKLARGLTRTAGGYDGVDVLGPAAAALPRLVGRWRIQILLRGAEPGPFRAFLRAVRRPIQEAAGRGVRVSVDVDPRHLM